MHLGLRPLKLVIPYFKFILTVLQINTMNETDRFVLGLRSTNEKIRRSLPSFVFAQNMICQIFLCSLRCLLCIADFCHKKNPQKIGRREGVNNREFLSLQ